MFCTKCGTEIREGQRFCSKCGTQVTAPEVKEETTEAAASVEVETATDTAAPAVEVEAAEVETETVATSAVEAETEEAAEAASAVETEAEAEAAAPAVEAEKTKKTSFKTKLSENKGLIICLVVFAALVLLAVILINACANSFHRLGKSNKYLKWVVEKNLDDSVADFVTGYDNSISVAKYYDEKISGDLKVEVSDAGSSYLALASVVGVDLTWIKDVEISGEISSKDYMVSADASLSSGKKNLADLTTVVDIKNAMTYMGLPSFSKKYLSYSLGEDGEELVSYIDIYKKAYGDIPAGKTVAKLLQKYTSIALSEVREENVSVKKTKTLRAGGVSEDVTALTVTIDEEMAKNCVEAVCNSLLEDEEVGKVISSLGYFAEKAEYPSSNVTPESIYESFISEVEHIVKNIDNYNFLGEEEYTVVLYVDSKGTIVGVETVADGTTVESVRTLNGSDVGYSTTVSNEWGEKVSISGSGSLKGDKLTGDFTLSYGRNDYLTDYAQISLVDFDLKAMARGKLSGEMVVTPSPALLQKYNLGAMNLNLRVVLSCDAKKGEVVFYVNMGESEIGKITASYKLSAGAKATIPAEKKTYSATNTEEINEYLSSLEFSSLIKSLESLGCPDEYLDMIDQLEKNVNSGLGALLW